MIALKDNYLFMGADISAYCAAKLKALQDHVDRISADVLASQPAEDLAQLLAKQFKVDVPILRADSIQVDPSEAKIDVSGDPQRRLAPDSGPFYAKGTRVVYCVPFDGDASIFSMQPNLCTSVYPRGSIAGSELRLTYETDTGEAEAMRQRFDRDLMLVKDFLGSAEASARSQNDSLTATALRFLNERKARLARDQQLTSGLGFPIRRRTDAPTTYAVPAVRRKVPLAPTVTKPASGIAEPALGMDEYEHILKVCSNMVQVMERSPVAFEAMDEEGIRSHFLVQLNGQYEGTATGETFNFSGKTDILIRWEGRNVFIAECKVWKGEATATKAIDQLLGYLTWRDTKAALFLFNRNKDFSAVIAKAREAVRAHPSFVRDVPYPGEAGFRLILRRPDDDQREIVLTVVAFDIPTRD